MSLDLPRSSHPWALLSLLCESESSTLVSGWYELKPAEEYDIQETADSMTCVPGDITESCTVTDSLMKVYIFNSV